MLVYSPSRSPEPSSEAENFPQYLLGHLSHSGVLHVLLWVGAVVICLLNFSRAILGQSIRRQLKKIL